LLIENYKYYSEVCNIVKKIIKKERGKKWNLMQKQYHQKTGKLF
jgi:hypothetical protein